MRRTARAERPTTAGQDYLATVSDLMSGLIFVFIITLAVFALLLAKEKADAAREKEKAAASHRELTESREVLTRILETLEKRLPGLQVHAVPDHGLLRLNEQVISFELARAEPNPGDRSNITKIARVLREVLACFVADPGGPVPADCPEGHGRARVEAVMVEGHTDALKTDPRLFYEGNLGLSTARAAKVMRLMEEDEPALSDLRNSSGLPILSVSGYGESRLLPGLPKEDPRHRRIDIRFLMEPPQAHEPEPTRSVRERLAQ